MEEAENRNSDQEAEESRKIRLLRVRKEHRREEVTHNPQARPALPANGGHGPEINCDGSFDDTLRVPLGSAFLGKAAVRLGATVSGG
jgi:hypothetical protein